MSAALSEIRCSWTDGVEELLTELRVYVMDTGGWPQEKITFVVVMVDMTSGLMVETLLRGVMQARLP